MREILRRIDLISAAVSSFADRTGRVMRRGFAPRGDWGRSRHPGGEYWDWQHQPVLVLRKPKRRAAEMLPGWVAKWSAAVQEGRCKQMPDWHVRP